MPEKRKLLDEDAVTPTGSPSKRPCITRRQKQALMDNLQLEITERARKLRAQYALQVNDLRARIERRVNRVPVALRKAKIGELLERYNAEQIQNQHRVTSKKVPSAKRMESATVISTDPDTHQRSPAPLRHVKKPSHEGMYSDKENAPASNPADSLNNPKRRTVNQAAGGSSRTISRKAKAADSRILSPKSLNSKTYTHSPLNGSPDKLQSQISRHGSPLKPSSPLKLASTTLTTSSRARATKPTAPGVKDSRPPSQLKGTVNRVGNTSSRAINSPVPRPATRQYDRRMSTSTTSSVRSSGTTVVKTTRPATAIGLRRPNTSQATHSTATSRKQAPTTAKKAPVSAAKGTPASDAQKQRTLRKRI